MNLIFKTKKPIVIFLFLLIVNSCSYERYKLSLTEIDSDHFSAAPVSYAEKPETPSPAINPTGREFVLVKTKNDRYSWIDATVENGDPFDYKQKLNGKGNQLLADTKDFPYFARKGIHSDKELRNTKMITGRSVSQITVDGRPGASSGVGFLAEDETIVSVIYKDNQTVKKLGLTHADIARPLFHFWNISKEFERFYSDSASGESTEIEALCYNGNKIKFEIQGSRGWQESIFNDEILGTGHIQIWRELDAEEVEFLQLNYSQLSREDLDLLQKKLSHFHTCEMVFFYINRYGFYEGHTEYRPDPVTVALVFGLSPIERAHKACNGDLFAYYNSHFTQNQK